MKKIFLISICLLMSFSSYSQENNCVCCTDKHGEFDFWVGKWSVTYPDGTLAGNNVIDKTQENCILRENWTGSKVNYTGHK